MTTKDATYMYTLRLGDDALILGHRLSELCSKGPLLEEDLAITNIALDMIGRAKALLTYVSDIIGNGTTEDDIAYRRAEINYYNHLLVEQPNGDFAHTMARQLFMSVLNIYFIRSLQKAEMKFCQLLQKAIKEVKYHMQHAIDWTLRLGDGTNESHKRMQRAVNNLWMYTGELFEMDEIEMHLMREGIAVDLIPIKSQWHNDIKVILNKATLIIPEDSYMQTGSKIGVHTENLGHILSEMQYLQKSLS